MRQDCPTFARSFFHWIYFDNIHVAHFISPFRPSHLEVPETVSIRLKFLSCFQQFVSQMINRTKWRMPPCFDERRLFLCGIQSRSTIAHHFIQFTETRDRGKVAWRVACRHQDGEPEFHPTKTGAALSVLFCQLANWIHWPVLMARPTVMLHLHVCERSHEIWFEVAYSIFKERNTCVARDRDKSDDVKIGKAIGFLCFLGTRFCTLFSSWKRTRGTRRSPSGGS